MAMEIKSLKRKTGFDTLEAYTDYLVRLSDDLEESGMVETAKDIRTAACIIFQEIALKGTLKELKLA